MHTELIDDDIRRQRHIIDKLVIGWIILSIVGVAVSIITFLGILTRSSHSHGSPFLLNCSVLAFFILLFFLSKKGFYRYVAVVLVVLILLLASYISFQWRADAPLALLLYALTIITAGVIVGTKASFFTTAISFIIMTIIAQLQSSGVIHYDKFWAIEPTGLKDTITASVALLIIAIVSFLSNYELEKALKRAKISETALQEQNDRLEKLVEKRTLELRQEQAEKLTQLYRFVEFGRAASGLFHDLVTPLNIVSLDLDKLSKKSKEVKKDEIKKLVNNSAKSVKKLEDFVLAARKQLQNQDELQLFSIKREIMEVLNILNYKIKMAHVHITCTGENDIKTYNNPIKFNQLLMNLLSNAIDAYDDSSNNQKNIAITVIEEKGNVIITVQDWANGIKKENIAKIFDPLFTTKSYHKGTGIGLSICQAIVQKNFNGTIRVKSRENKGTTFIIRFPIERPPTGKIKRENKN